MNLFSLLPWRRKRGAHRASRPDETALPERDAYDEVRPHGCGWFDSSHDLQHGLSVREHASADTLSRELPLANWLDLQLAGWRAGVPIAHQK